MSFLIFSSFTFSSWNHSWSDILVSSGSFSSQNTRSSNCVLSDSRSVLILFKFLSSGFYERTMVWTRSIFDKTDLISASNLNLFENGDESCVSVVVENYLFWLIFFILEKIYFEFWFYIFLIDWNQEQMYSFFHWL